MKMFPRYHHQIASQHHSESEPATPFFSKAGADSIQTKTDDGAFFQTKLKIGEPNDKYEQEADRVADAVVNRSGNQKGAIAQGQGVGDVQRVTLATPIEDEKLSTAEGRMEKDKLIQEKPEEGMLNKMEEEEETLQAKEDEEENMLQAKTAGNNATTGSTGAGLSQQLKSKSGRGKKLPNSVRAEMESSIGADFSAVNIHTDQEAVAMNQSLHAQAFTHGKDVYFNEGKFKPESSAGKHLLAHELTHVVQQGASPKVDKKSKP